jgi:hypothetical protein
VISGQEQMLCLGNPHMRTLSIRKGYSVAVEYGGVPVVFVMAVQGDQIDLL